MSAPIHFLLSLLESAHANKDFPLLQSLLTADLFPGPFRNILLTSPLTMLRFKT